MSSNGVLVDSTGTILAVVHGFSGKAPTGQTFQALASVDGLNAGQKAPTAAVQTLASTDHEMSRGLEDLVAVLLTKGTILKTDLSADLLSKIDARRALRGQATL